MRELRMIIDVIKDFYNGMIKMQEPVDCDSYDLPEEIKALLSQTNGIQETHFIYPTARYMNLIL